VRDLRDPLEDGDAPGRELALKAGMGSSVPGIDTSTMRNPLPFQSRISAPFGGKWSSRAGRIGARTSQRW
jgi:hypothetical protein